MKIKQALCDVAKNLSAFFNSVSREWPEAIVQQEMTAEGWKFSTYNPVLGNAYMTMPVVVLLVSTPEGRPALNGDVAPEDRERYLNTVAEKRRQHGLQP